MSSGRQTQERRTSGLWSGRRCTGCQQACRYADQDAGGLTYREARGIRFKEFNEARKRGEYGPRVRDTRARVLGLLHQTKRELWQELIANCPERIYPAPGEDGPLDYDARDPDDSAEVAAAQAAQMEFPISRGELEAQLSQVFPSDAEEWERMLAEQYKAELAYRRKHGAPRRPEQPEAVAEVQADLEPMPWDEGFVGGTW
jgi:hypothetical protein